jgi:hypothetical protein
VSIQREGTAIHVKDYNANVTLATIHLTPQQLNDCLSGLGYVPCEIEIKALDKVGKTHECKAFEFEMPLITSTNDRKAIAVDAVNALLDNNAEGWIPDRYFGSQDSFFKKDGKDYARCTIRRWV